VGITDLFRDFDRLSPVPLYHQLAECIEAAIRGDRLAPGARLENEISLSVRLGLSRPTVRRAIEQLVSKGLLVRTRGVGTQVVQAPVTREAGISSLYEDLSASGQSPETTLLSQELIDADRDAAQALGVAPGSPVWRIIRVRRANGRPLAILDNVLPVGLGPFDESELATTGLYRLLGQRAVVVRITDQVVSARAATPDEAETLELQTHEPVLTVARTAFDKRGRAVEYGRHRYAPDRYELRYSLVGTN
jgi:DNA-binding GntR family transcriptional regulator